MVHGNYGARVPAAAKTGRSLVCAASAEVAYRDVSHTVADTALVTEETQVAAHKALLPWTKISLLVYGRKTPSLPLANLPTYPLQFLFLYKGKIASPNNSTYCSAKSTLCMCRFC